MISSRFIDPISDFGKDLFSVRKPARYIGGEVGASLPILPSDSRLRFALCFPDLYEIGMSNNAIRLLYNDIAKFSDIVVCERVFVPAPDFEDLLRKNCIPLYTLESGIPLRDCDILGFSIGYELLATNMLTVLETGGIPLETSARGEGDPLIIAGGPAITNPHTLSRFIDAAYIGEAEAGFYRILKEIALIKARGGGRSAYLEFLSGQEAVWLSPRLSVTSKKKKARRAVFDDFSTHPASTAFPLTTIQAVHSQGTVEIMRGCPNGCRFCHAGYHYRPQRVKSLACIEAEIRNLVHEGGYREITLASLSSGDYPDISGLVRKLNDEWKSSSVSFQLPSLKIDSFNLPLLKELSEVRKSGLTFAVETPVDAWQRSINKTVDFDKIVDILNEARNMGFRSAKFYFMIGLPVPGRGAGEAAAIVEFLERITSKVRITLSVNIGTFVPKPHTPYQREAQIGEEEAKSAIYFIKDSLRRNKAISISYQSPFTSVLEGILSRGDERVGDIILKAYRRGARLDAWDDYFKKEAWLEAFEDARTTMGFDPSEEFLRYREPDTSLTWKDIDILVSKAYLEKETRRSADSLLTAGCREECDHQCGSCGNDHAIVLNNIQDELSIPEIIPVKAQIGLVWAGLNEGSAEDSRLIMSFSKTGKGVFYPLHAISGLFARALTILNIPLRYTEGFNPQPRMELTQPLALGIESDDDIIALWLKCDADLTDRDAFIARIQSLLPQGIFLRRARIAKRRTEGKKSIGSIYWGSEYVIRSSRDFIEKIYAMNKQDFLIESLSDLDKIRVLVGDARGGETSLMSHLGKICPLEKVMDNFKIRRTACMAVSESGRALLFDIL